MFSWKKVRYGYWVALSFFKKNLQPIVFSFVASIIGIIAVISFSPYLLKSLTTNKHIIGVAGRYSVDSLPDSILAKVSNGLVFITGKGEVVPLLADSWEQLDNGKEFRFHLKKDLIWNSGKPFIAENVKYSFKDVETKYDGDFLLVYKLKKSLPIFPIYLTKPLVQHPLDGVGGLYKIEKAIIKYGEVQELELTPNKPKLPILIYRFFDSDSKLINAYKLGQIQEMVINKDKVAANLSNWPNTTITKSIDFTQVVALFFNLNDKLLGEDKNIRKAVANAIDSKQFVELGEKADGPLSLTSWAHNPDLKKFLYDPDKAENELNKVMDSTHSAELTINTYYEYLNVAENIKDDLNKVGVKAKVEIVQFNRPQNYQLLVASLQLGNDPDQYFYWHSTQKRGNITDYKNVKVDKLLEDGRNTLSPIKRKSIYFEFQKILNDELPAYFLYYPYTYTIIRK